MSKIIVFGEVCGGLSKKKRSNNEMANALESRNSFSRPKLDVGT